MEFVRIHLSRGDGASTGAGRGCGWMIDSVGVSGAGMTQVKGLRTSKSPGVPASAALVAQRAVSVVVLPSGSTETEEFRHVCRISGTAVGLQVN